MDTWLIAHCMARLPRSTYFSHPESSLDDFFSAEASMVMDGNHRDDSSSSIQQGLAPHELEFLRSLNESLGIHPTLMSGGVAEPDSRCYRGGIVSRGHPSDSASQCWGTIADERTWSHPMEPLIGNFLNADPFDAPASSSSPTLMPMLPSSSTSADIQAPAWSSSVQHAVSSTDQDRPESARPQTIANASRTSPRYQCYWEVAEKRPCGEWIEGGSKEVWSHIRAAHGLKGLYGSWYRCKWGGCLEKLKISSLQRHIARHLEIKWRCSSCDMVFARYDYVRRHIKLNGECRAADAVRHLVSEQASGTSMGSAVGGVAGSFLDDG